MSDPSVASKLASLVSWRQSVVDSGRNPASLPSDRDLVAMARTVEISKPAMTNLDLERPSAFLSYSAGILAALRSGLANVSAGGAPPRLPPGIAAILTADATEGDSKGPPNPERSTQILSAAHVLRDLLTWRDGMVSSGRDSQSLPSDRDLVQMARCGVPKRAVIEDLDLDRPAAAKEFGMGIVGAIRSGLAVAEAGKDLPPLPSHLEELLPPERPLRLDFELPSDGSVIEVDEQPGATVGTPDRAPESPVSTTNPPAAPNDSDDSSRSSGSPSNVDSLTPVEPPSRRRRSGGPSRTADTPQEFAPYIPAEQGPSSPATCAQREEGVEISWLSPPTDGFRLYRVVSADGYKPFDPEHGLLATTMEPKAFDSNPTIGAVRYYAVWVNEGRDETEARMTQARLLAEGYTVAPPADVVVVEDHGTVFGRWTVHEGVDRVEVQRIPSGLAQSGTYLSQYAVARESRNLKGFSDPACPPGSDVVYRVFAVVESEEGELLISAPVSRDISTEGVIPEMGKIEAVAHADRPVVDLAWPQSVSADVRIYRTDQPPSIGAQRTIPASALDVVFGAPVPDVEVKLTPEWSDGKAFLAGIPWPPGWTRVYFTAVAFDRQLATVGPTATLARSGRITDAVVHERVTWQQLTFNWPLGADEVRVYTTPVGAQLGDQVGDPVHIVTFDQHRELGAIRLSGQRLLPKEGCDLHLLPITYNVEGAIRGGPAVVRYSGLLRVKYDIVEGQIAEPQGRRGSRAAPQASGTAVVQIATDWVPPDLQIEVTLVANPNRLPLSVRDGNPVKTTKLFPPGRQWVPVCEFDRAAYRGQFVRLFVTNPGVDLQLAVLDPALRALRQ